jgi:hypothetical protein
MLLLFLVWQVFQDQTPQPSVIDARAADGAPPRPRSSSVLPPPPSSLAFTGSAADLPFAPEKSATPVLPAPDPEEEFRQAVAASESKARALAMSYTKRYPSIANYGRDWMSYPDLKKLNDDYMRERDPVKFMRGLARSENFPKLIKKYAGDPAIHAFVIEAIKEAPIDLAAAAAGYLPGDALARSSVDGVAGALGLPAALTSGVLKETRLDARRNPGKSGPEPKGDGRSPNNGRH